VVARLAVVLVAGGVLLAACSPPPAQRPLEGARVGGEVGGARKDQPGTPLVTGPPPTLSAPGQSQPASGQSQASGPVASLSPGAPSPSPSPPTGPPHVIVATDGRGANLRTGPGTTGRVITTLAEGTVVEVLGEPVTVEGRPWRMIRSAGREGWVLAVVVRPR